MSYALELVLLIVALAAEFAGHPKWSHSAWALLAAKLWLRCQRSERALADYMEETRQAVQRLRAWRLSR